MQNEFIISKKHSWNTGFHILSQEEIQIHKMHYEFIQRNLDSFDVIWTHRMLHGFTGCSIIHWVEYEKIIYFNFDGFFQLTCEQSWLHPLSNLDVLTMRYRVTNIYIEREEILYCYCLNNKPGQTVMIMTSQIPKTLKTSSEHV